MSEPTAVYELFDRLGGRVYIGMSRDPRRRFSEHRSAPWWPLVDESRTVVAWYASRAEAADVEMLLIGTHRPPHNITVPGPRPAPVGWQTYQPIDWDAELARLTSLKDPSDRARQASSAIASLSRESMVFKRQRQSAVLELRDRGMSLAEIGRELGLHRNRVQKIGEGA